MTSEPLWRNGKAHSYQSDYDHQSSETAVPNINVPNIESTSELAGVTTASPAKRYPTAKKTDKTSQNACQICGNSDDVSFWIGCGHKNKNTKKNDCSYWVHQWCVGLYFKTEDALKKMPFYCQRHGKPKRLKGVGKKKVN